MSKPDLNDPEQRERARNQLVAELWRRGVLEYRLKATQQLIHAKLVDNPARRHFLLCSRRLGKTDVCFTRASEVAISKPNARILYLAPYSKDAAKIARDTFMEVFKDCPENLKPEWKDQSKEFRFKNGSIIQLAGVNSETADQLRGGSADLIILDEAGSMDNLRYVLNSVCGPMVMTTKGHILIATTPPPTPAHDSKKIFEEYAARGWVSVFTLLDADEDLVPYEEKIRALMNCGETEEHAALCLAGKAEPKTTEAQREYWAKWVTDASLAIVPEFAEAKQDIIKDWKRPPYFDFYCGIDPGSKDNTGIVYCYVDFLKGKVIVEDEALLQNPSTDDIAKEIVRIENDTFQGMKPRSRVSDIDLRLMQDLGRLYKIAVTPADKREGMLSSVQLLRHFVKQRILVINPRCVHTIRQLENAIWNKKANDMARAPEDESNNLTDAHYDLVSALRYLLRAVNLRHNPYPDGFMSPGGEGGVPINRFVSPKGRKPGGWGLYTDTAITRKLRGGK